MERRLLTVLLATAALLAGLNVAVYLWRTFRPPAPAEPPPPIRAELPFETWRNASGLLVRALEQDPGFLEPEQAARFSQALEGASPAQVRIDELRGELWATLTDAQRQQVKRTMAEPPPPPPEPGAQRPLLDDPDRALALLERELAGASPVAEASPKAQISELLLADLLYSLVTLEEQGALGLSAEQRGRVLSIVQRMREARVPVRNALAQALAALTPDQVRHLGSLRESPVPPPAGQDPLQRLRDLLAKGERT